MYNCFLTCLGIGYVLAACFWIGVGRGKNEGLSRHVATCVFWPIWYVVSVGRAARRVADELDVSGSTEQHPPTGSEQEKRDAE